MTGGPTIRRRTRPTALNASDVDEAAGAPPDRLADSDAQTPRSSGARDYEVGRGRPPVRTRFGQEGGNKPGRKRRSSVSSLDDALARQLARRHTINGNKKIYGDDLFATIVFQGALKGNSTDKKIVVAAAQRTVSKALAAAIDPTTAPPMTDADRAMLMALLELSTTPNTTGDGGDDG